MDEEGSFTDDPLSNAARMYSSGPSTSEIEIKNEKGTLSDTEINIGSLENYRNLRKLSLAMNEIS